LCARELNDTVHFGFEEEFVMRNLLGGDEEKPDTTVTGGGDEEKPVPGIAGGDEEQKPT
jgi:hypothetical protein